MANRFRGGVHPDDSKHTRALPVTGVQPADRLILSLSQHIGAPSRPEVSVGDRVLKYQTVASPGGFVSTALHAPTSGTVKAIEPAPHPSGRFVSAVILEPDGLDEAADLKDRADPGLTRGPEAWKEIIRAREKFRDWDSPEVGAREAMERAGESLDICADQLRQIVRKLEGID